MLWNSAVPQKWLEATEYYSIQLSLCQITDAAELIHSGLP